MLVLRLVLIAWAIFLALNPIYTPCAFQSNRINWTADGLNHFVPDFFKRLVRHREPYGINGYESYGVVVFTDSRFHIVPPLVSAVSSAFEKFIGDIRVTNHFPYRFFKSIQGEFGFDLPIVGNAEGDLYHNDEWRAVIEPRENRVGQQIPRDTLQGFLSISNQIRFQLFFDLVSPSFREPKRRRFLCSFLGEAVEYLPGDCVSVPQDDPPALGERISSSGSRDYQLVAKCGDLTTIIEIPMRRGHVHPAVSRDDDFFLRRVKNDQSAGAGFDLGTCYQRNQNDRADQTNRVEGSFHMWVNSGETTVSSYSEAKRLLVIQNATVFVKSLEGDKYEIIAPLGVLKHSKRK